MRKRNNLLLIGSLLISGISLSTLSSCNAVQKENELTSITTSDSELILSINETKTISITCNPSNYDVKKLKYSFDSNIISFNQDKLEITGLKKGETNLVISGGKNISTTINIKVEDIVATSIDSSFSRKIIGIDEEIQINVTFSPSNITNKELRFISSNTSVLSVSNTGLIKGLTSGTSTLTISYPANNNVSDLV